MIFKKAHSLTAAEGYSGIFYFPFFPIPLSIPPVLLPSYLPTYLPIYLPIFLPTFLPTYLPIYVWCLDRIVSFPKSLLITEYKRILKQSFYLENRETK